MLNELMPSLFFLIICLLVVKSHNKSGIYTETKVIDVGVVRLGEIKEFSFRLGNRGKKTIEIISMITDCSCSSFLPDTFGLKPGEEREIKMIFDSNRTEFNGEFTRNIMLYSNRKQGPIHQFKIIGKLIK